MSHLKNKFLAFCATMPADRSYDYGDPHDCALGQFAQSLGFTTDHRDVFCLSPCAQLMRSDLGREENWDKGSAVPEDWKRLLNAVYPENTFGALTARLIQSLKPVQLELDFTEPELADA
jgi:hypothetical protein